jgi:hypothetical protein
MDSAFMLLGTRHHQKLDFAAKQLNLASEQVLDSEISGIMDLLEPDELHEGFFKLVDYKTSGSYAISKALGRKSETGESDMRDWELQINKYRIELERLGAKISRMFVQGCVRDGGTYAARNNGVPEKFVMIPVKQLDDQEVFYYFKDKADIIKKALEATELPKLCSWEERWANRRCIDNYCPVVQWCPEGSKMTKSKG